MILSKYFNQRFQTLYICAMIALLLGGCSASNAVSFAAANDISISTSLKQGTVQDTPELNFFYNIRYKDAAGKLNYIQPDNVFANDKTLINYGNTYRGQLNEGENKIVVKYINNGETIYDVYYYYVDTEAPFVNVKGIYNHMLSDSRNISFSVLTADEQSVPEALTTKVYLNDRELKEYNGTYKGVLNSSYPNYKQQEEATEDQHFTNNEIKIVTKDGVGNEGTYIYNVIYAPRQIDYSQLRYLIEKIPGLLPETPMYSNFSERYSEVGVALDDSNITMLGTYGGYVVLGHDTPIINGPADDFVVNAHWSDAGENLTSVMVMQDTNQNHLPDDTWYYIDDLGDTTHEVINHKISYFFANKGSYMDKNGNSAELLLKLPVKTPLSTPYLQMAKTLHKNTFSGAYYTLYANLRVLHQDMIKSISLKTKGYDISDAKDFDKNPVTLDSIDFVKVYTNTLDIMEGVGSVMPAVNYVRVNEDMPLMLNCDSNYLSYDYASLNLGYGDVLSMNIDALVELDYSRVRPELNEDYVFKYQADYYNNQLPYKIEDKQVILFYPYDRSTISAKSFVETISDEIISMTSLVDNQQKIQDLTWLELVRIRNKTNLLMYDGVNLSTTFEGQLELLKGQLDQEMNDRLNDGFMRLHNSFEELKLLKWKMDFLSDEDFNRIPVGNRVDLEYWLLEMLDYDKQSFTFEPTAGNRYTITPLRNIAYNMSVEELERFIAPSLSIYALANQDKESRVTFHIDFYKDHKVMNRLYRPISYNVLLTEPWTSSNRLYYISGDAYLEIPVTVTQDGTNLNFETDMLGNFVIKQ